MSTDVRDHGCQVRVTRRNPNRRERRPMGRGERGKSQKLNPKATPGRNRAAAPFLRDMNCRQSRSRWAVRWVPRNRDRQRRPPDRR
jgi:hypothetical protein